MLESVGGQVPEDQLAKTAFYLMKDVGLSHKEIFGDYRYVNFTEERSRDGFLGDFIDYVLGKKKVETTEKIKSRGMNLKTFVAYAELLEEHQEEKKKQQETQKAKNSLSQTFR